MSEAFWFGFFALIGAAVAACLLAVIALAIMHGPDFPGDGA